MSGRTIPLVRRQPHTCHAIGCERSVPPAMFACAPHWNQLPYVMRQAIYRTYRKGQEIDKQPSPEYLEAAHAAIHWLHEHEKIIGTLCPVCIESGASPLAQRLAQRREQPHP